MYISVYLFVFFSNYILCLSSLLPCPLRSLWLFTFSSDILLFFYATPNYTIYILIISRYKYVHLLKHFLLCVVSVGFSNMLTRMCYLSILYNLAWAANSVESSSPSSLAASSRHCLKWWVPLTNFSPWTSRSLTLATLNCNAFFLIM